MQSFPIKISIIVNTFNVSKYIIRTIESICSQLTNETELIIIDDGSTDDTVKKIKKNMPVNHNVHLIAQVHNKGISAERNYGILRATGKYILFIDGDDYIDPQTISKLLGIVEQNDFDIVGYNMEAVPDYINKNSLSSREKKYVSSELKAGIYTKDQLLNSLFKNELKHNPVSYLFKRELFLRNDIFFPEDINYGEDYATIYKFFDSVKEGKVVNERLYKYVQRTSSATHKPRVKYAQDNLQVSREILRYFENTDYCSGAQNYVIPRLITALSIAARTKASNSKILVQEVETEIKSLSRTNHQLRKYLTSNLRLKVYLNNAGLLKYIYYYKGLS
ncbi:glycosyltransferase family 2 protein [Leuconostoc mesenteroides]|uniref:GT n=1 Tax=Leuconostoc mesenteroides TaxID=1245 RepID=A0A7S7A9L1_LEUME|nr:glycosyltransferase family 2 protein [Leuconostoc mesenteroides]QOW37895.1 GT [Leuconostoc mesenteroides]